MIKTHRQTTLLLAALMAAGVELPEVEAKRVRRHETQPKGAHQGSKEKQRRLRQRERLLSKGASLTSQDTTETKESK